MREADLSPMSDHPVSGKAEKPATLLEVFSLCFSLSAKETELR